MALISMQEVSLGFGGPLLLEGINLQIERGEWVGLLGRNGTGKSTLLKLVNGDLSPESGVVSRQQGLRVAYLPQEVPQGLAGSITDIVASGLEPPLGEPGSDKHWQEQLQVEQILARMQLDPGARGARCSGARPKNLQSVERNLAQLRLRGLGCAIGKRRHGGKHDAYRLITLCQDSRNPPGVSFARFELHGFVLLRV